MKPLAAIDELLKSADPPLTVVTAEPWVLPLIDTTGWVTNDPPAREWIVSGWLARGTVCLLSGDPGVGKSLLGQQLATARWAGRPFLGLPSAAGPSLYVTAEDDPAELHRRQNGINRRLGLPKGAAPQLCSLLGYTDAQLGFFDPTGRFIRGGVFEAIRAACQKHADTLVILDNVACLFPGDENRRADVAAFCNALAGLAIEAACTIVLLAHPAKAEGSQWSGSTAWNAHVRARWFLDRPDQDDPDARRLCRSKSNHGRVGEEIRFRWIDWAFATDDELPADTRAEMDAVIRANADDERFLACLRARAHQGDGRHVGPTPGPNYAPSQFEGMREALGLRRDRLRLAMERLFAAGAIRTERVRNAAKGRDVTAIVEVAGVPRTAPRTVPELVPDPVPDAALTAPDPPRTHTPLLRKGIGTPALGGVPYPDDDDFDPLEHPRNL